MTRPTRALVRLAAPLVASGAVVITLATCFAIAKARDVYTGGLQWPYFSDMGRDAPGYYVFCVGLTLTAIALIATWSFNYEFQRSALRRPRLHGHVGAGVSRAAIVCVGLGCVSTVGLPVLAFFSTSSYPKLHNNAAYWFFCLETVAVFLNTFVTFRIFRTARCPETCAGALNAPMPAADELELTVSSLKRTFVVQAGFTALFFIAFLLYIPVGLAIIAPFQRLTIAECLERDLGQEYCTVTMKYDAVETKLWNYEGDFTATQVRAAAQLGCILTLVGYSISFMTHDYSGGKGSQRVSSTEPATSVPFTAITMESGDARRMAAP